jgi:hypothetical protein
MKKKLPKILIFPIVIIALIIIIATYLRKDVTVSNVSTDCRKNPCKINFILTNKTNHYLSCNVSIRAHRKTPGAKSARAVEAGFAGEKIIEIELFPKEKRKIEETLLLTGMKSRIRVNAYNVKKR